MDEINQIYCGDSYTAFLDYCDLHGFKRMRDLVGCRFEELPELIGISPSLLSRIKMICVLYFKKHPECLTSAKKSKKATLSAADTEELKDKLLVFFQQNANRLIHISEISKALNKEVKRADIIHVLEHQKWCKIVDNTTFFYSPVE